MNRDEFIKYKSDNNKSLIISTLKSLIATAITYIAILICLSHFDFTVPVTIAEIIGCVLLGFNIAASIKTYELKIVKEFMDKNKKYKIAEGYLYQYLKDLNRYCLAIASLSITIALLIFIIKTNNVTIIYYIIEGLMVITTYVSYKIGGLIFNLDKDIKLTKLL